MGGKETFMKGRACLRCADLGLGCAISPEVGVGKLFSVPLAGLAPKCYVALDGKIFKLVHDKLRKCWKNQRGN